MGGGGSDSVINVEVYRSVLYTEVYTLPIVFVYTSRSLPI